MQHPHPAVSVHLQPGKHWGWAGSCQYYGSWSWHHRRSPGCTAKQVNRLCSIFCHRLKIVLSCWQIQSLYLVVFSLCVFQLWLWGSRSNPDPDSQAGLLCHQQRHPPEATIWRGVPSWAGPDPTWWPWQQSHRCPSQVYLSQTWSSAASPGNPAAQTAGHSKDLKNIIFGPSFTLFDSLPFALLKVTALHC